MSHPVRLPALTLLALLSACGQGTVIDESKCSKTALEADFSASPLAGPRADGGVLPPGPWLVSTTYLRLVPEPAAAAAFQAVMGPVAAALPTTPGLAAVSIGTSTACATARTLAVWEDQASMLDFVTGPAHAAAMAHIGDFSRGGSTTLHFTADGGVGWTDAAARLSGSHSSF